MADRNTILLAEMALFAFIGAWSALLAHKAIANFHDGIRPMYPVFKAGQMDRKEFAKLSYTISVGFVIGFGVPLSLATQIMLIIVMLLPADVLGIASNNSTKAFLLGGVWGILCYLFIFASKAMVTVAPVALMPAVAQAVKIFLVVFSITPVVTAAIQYGVKKALIPLAATILLRIFVQKEWLILPDSVSTEFCCLLLGTVILLALNLLEKKESEFASEFDDGEGSSGLFTENYKVIRKNAPYLAVQGALLATAARLFLLSSSEVAVLPLSQGLLLDAAMVDTVYALAFFPMFTMSCASTAVYVSAGFLMIFPISILLPELWMAPIVGAVLMVAGAMLLHPFYKILDWKPNLTVMGESLRSACSKTLELGTMIGCGAASLSLLPDGCGLWIVAAIYILNEIAGQKVTRSVVSVIGLLVAWAVSNLLYIV